MSADLKHCVACQFHRLFDDRLHLCKLPPDFAPVTVYRFDEHWLDHADGQAEYLGTACDVMRRQDAACGPDGAQWRPVPSIAAEVQS